MLIKRIATIEDSFARDTQIFTANPAIVDVMFDYDENFCGVKYPCHYIGVYEGADEKEIREKAAAVMGVHPDTVTLTEIDQKNDILPGAAVRRTSEYVCPVCKNEDHPTEARFCKICGTRIPLPQADVDLAAEADKFVYERLHAHVGHKVVVVNYADDRNVSVECMKCNEVLYSVDNPKYRC